MATKHKALVVALLTVVTSSAVAAGDGPEEVIRALYKAHRPWEHKKLNLGNRAVLSKYFSPELTKLFLKNAQLERDCPKGDLCGLDFDPILDAQDFDDHLDFKLHITEATPPQTGRFEARFKLFNEEKPEQEQVRLAAAGRSALCRVAAVRCRTEVSLLQRREAQSILR